VREVKRSLPITIICLLFAIGLPAIPAQQQMSASPALIESLGNTSPLTRQQKEGWFYAGSDKLFDYYYNPKTAIKAAGRTISIWIKKMPVPNASRVDVLQNLEWGREDFALSKYGKYSYTLRHETYDCKERKHKLLELLDYDSNGIVIYSSTYNADWDEIAH